MVAGDNWSLKWPPLVLQFSERIKQLYILFLAEENQRLHLKGQFQPMEDITKMFKSKIWERERERERENQHQELNYTTGYFYVKSCDSESGKSWLMVRVSLPSWISLHIFPQEAEWQFINSPPQELSRYLCSGLLYPEKVHWPQPGLNLGFRHGNISQAPQRQTFQHTN